jgi:putative transposase
VARVARKFTVEKGSTNHCTWRSNCGALVLEFEGARAKFLALLRKYKDKYGILIRSYCLMGNHPHVVTTALKGQKAFSSFWKCVNHAFACWYNARTAGCGKVVRERMRSPRIQDGRHELVVMRYCDLNPVRAGLVPTAGRWEWSSYRHYAYGEPNDLITDSPEYLALGFCPATRRKAYQNLSDPLSDTLLRRRRDLAHRPFIGDPEWVEARHDEYGLPPAPD